MAMAPRLSGRKLYCDFAAANDSGTGLTVDSPKKLLSSISALIQNGDEIHLTGDYDDTAGVFEMSNHEDLWIRRWPGKLPYWARHARTIAANAWSVHSGNCYKATVGNFANGVLSVAMRMLDPSNRDAFGRPKSHMQPAADVTACIANAYTFFFDNSGGGTIYANFSGVNPTTLTAYLCELCLGGLYPNGGYMFAGNNLKRVLLDDFNARNYLQNTVTGYMYNLTGEDVEVRGGVCMNAGWHAGGHVSSGSSEPQYRCRETRMRFMGGGTGTGAVQNQPAAQLVWYGQNTNVRKGSASFCDFLQYRLVDPTGADWGREGCYGVIAHYGGTGEIEDLDLYSCRFIEFDTSTAPFLSLDVPVPADGSDEEMNPLSYRARCHNCDFVTKRLPGNTGQRKKTLPAGAALIACRIDIRDYATEATTGFGTNALQLEGKLLLDSCHVVMDLSCPAGPTLAYGIRLYNNARLNAKATTIANQNGINGIAATLFQRNHDNYKVRMHGCVLQCASPGTTARNLFNDDSTVADANYDMRNNVYINVAANNWSSASSRNTEAEWKATIDAMAITTLDVGLVAASTLYSDDPTLGWDAENTTLQPITVGGPPSGMGPGAYNRRPGPIQSGKTPATLRNRAGRDFRV